MGMLEITIDIDWGEIDYMGHVNNLSILRYVQTARVHYCEQVGMMPYQANDGTGPILASIECQYAAPLFYPGKVTVQTAVERIGGTSIIMRHRLFSGDESLAAEARDILVYFDYDKGEKKAVPQALREKLLAVGREGEE
ncbi:MAG: thioesterase family protein [Oscillospiraceae bacterium]|nr:thioesterase family protein [Oscillospiraceae bacterium]